MKYLLDTCIVSELSKKKPDINVIKWIKDKHETDLYMSVLTLGEIQGLAEQQGNKMPVVDSLIAATGLTYNFEIITRNTDDMKASGVQLFNPWVL